ncbi:hypothetical protein FBU30_007031 [Linnemannia zychae]|nr:hypothetical protein FBU30_007031 [Linnemannia zychae]
MAGGNQTRLGLVHQKPGTRRTLNSKRAVDAASNNGGSKTEKALPAEQLLEKASALTQTMEEKLMEYKKTKEEEKRSKNVTTTTVSTRSTRSIVKHSEGIGKGTVTQRSLRSMMQTSATKILVTKTAASEITTISIPSSQESAISDSTVVTESINANEKHDSILNQDNKDEQEEAPIVQKFHDSEPSNRDAQVQTDDIKPASEKKEAVVTMRVVQQTEEKSEEAEDDSVVPTQEGSPRKVSVTKETAKPVLKDTTAQITEDEDEDNIHPLARTVVKSTVRTHRRRSHETISHDLTDKAHKPVNIPSKSPQKIIVQESALPESLLPFPSHMTALFELFKGLDSVLEFTKRQGQLCFYHKLKKHVELQSGRNFEIKHLAQLKAILPEGYKLTEAPCLFEGVKTRSILIDMPALKNDDSEGNFIPENEKRRKLFVERLYNRIKPHHQTFLHSTTPHRTDTFPYEWHPDFDLETVTPVEEADIPLLKPVIVDSSKMDLKNLGLRKDVVKAHTKSISITQEASTSTSQKKPQAVTAADFPPDAPIRQKQIEKKDQNKGLGSAEEKRQALIASRLPAVFDLIRFKRIDVISLKALTEQVVKSSRQPISEVEGRDSLEMMAKTLPEWCSVFTTNDGVKYFKVLRDDGHGNKILHDERALRTRLVTKSMKSL